METNGWIKLHRKMLEWEWYNDSNTFRLFIHLLLLANHEKKRWRGIEINRGELVTGRKKLAKELMLSERKIRTSLMRLKSTNEIAIKTTNKYSIISICNYSTYQTKDNAKRPAERPTSSPTSDQQVTTNKNDKNNKENKNIYTQTDERTKRFQEMVNREFPNVAKMDKQITDNELKKLLEKYTPKEIKTVLTVMENWKPLTKKNISVGKTLEVWLRREYAA